MFIRLLVFVMISIPAYADGPICGPHPRARDTDHALIQEADLTAEAVKKAEKDIQALKNPPPDAPGELEIFAAVGKKIIDGYKLKLEYQKKPSPAAKKKFCIWMANEAFWPE